MDYKEKYENALERMKSWANGEHPECFSEAQKAAEFIFPELAQSEDERIRKMLITIYKKTDMGGEIFGEGITYKQVVSWLEKQGEPQPYKGNADTMRKNLIKAFKSVGSNYWGGFDVRNILNFLESKDAIELEKQDEQNPAWSEEDEVMLKDAIEFFETGWSDRGKSHLVYWFKSFKNRVQPQPKQEWSEEDEDAIGMAIKALEDLCDVDCPTDSFVGHNLSFDEAVQRLKCLKPQSHWKPTEEQLMALRDAIDNNEMESLYNDLKKL